jgi:2,4-dienoyl-CoA reductase-like NADH-dependent reductase (Old Yellow Enzyme family)
MEKIFSPIQIGTKTAPNRLASQAMEGNDGEKGGNPSVLTIERYENLARGGWGLVIVEATSVTTESLARINCLCLNENTLERFKVLVDAFRKINPDAVLLLQITHSGMKSIPAFSKKVGICPDPSADTDGTTPHVLTEAEIEVIRKAFVQTTLLAKAAGFDGADFKLCHGYFGAEMLRLANIRSDRWGGSFKNRTRFLTEGVEEIRAQLGGAEFILGSRISMYEGIRGGCGTAGPEEIIEDLTEMDSLISLMDDLGMDYINVSAGVPGVTSEITRPVKSSRWLYLHQFRYAKYAKELLQLRNSRMKTIGSTYTVLGEDAAAAAGENILKGYTDLAGFGRQSFADPLYPVKLKNGEKINYCTLCSGCSKLMIRQLHDGCILYNEYYKDLNRRQRN